MDYWTGFSSGQGFDVCGNDSIRSSERKAPLNHSYSVEYCAFPPGPDYSYNGKASLENCCDYSPSQHSLMPSPCLKPRRNPIDSSTSGKFADRPFGTSKGSRKGGSGLRQPQISTRDIQAQLARIRRSVPPAPSNSRHRKEEEKVEKFLLTNPTFLRTFVNNHVDPKTLEEWSKPNEAPPAERPAIPVSRQESALPQEVKVGLTDRPVTSIKQSAEIFVEREVPITEEPLVVAEEVDDEKLKTDNEEEDAVAEEDENKLKTDEDTGDQETKTDAVAEEKIPEITSEKEVSKGSEEDKRQSEEEAPGSSDLVEPDVDDLSWESKINLATTSTSTIDAVLFVADLFVPLMATASTSTTDGLVHVPLGPRIPNPKVAANLSRISQIREARRRQKECSEAKAQAQLAAKRNRSKSKSRGSKHSSERRNKAGSEDSSKRSSKGSNGVPEEDGCEDDDEGEGRRKSRNKSADKGGKGQLRDRKSSDLKSDRPTRNSKSTGANPEEPSVNSQMPKPTVAAEKSKPTVAAEKSEPTATAEKSKPTVAAEKSEPTVAAEKSKPTVGAKKPKPGMAAQKSKSSVEVRDAAASSILNNPILDLIVKFHNRKPKYLSQYEEVDADDDCDSENTVAENFLEECHEWLMHQYTLDKNGVQN